MRNWLARNLAEYSLWVKLIIIVALYVACTFLGWSQIVLVPQFHQSAFAVLFIPLIIGSLQLEVKGGIVLSFCTTSLILLLAHRLNQVLPMNAGEFFLTVFFPCLAAMLGGVFIGAFNLYRRSKEQHIRESETKYRTLIEVAGEANEGIFILQNDAPGTPVLQFVNKAMTDMLEYPESSLVGHTLHHLLDEDAEAFLLDQYRRRLAGERVLGYQELEMIRRDGTRIATEIAMGTTAYEGRPALICYFRDITIKKQLESELRDLVRRDHLTKLFNKRYFEEQLQAEITRSERYGQVFSILYVDIDNFKHYNDTRGHLAGDRLITRTSELIADQLRAADRAFRYGGEEYTVILPLTDIKGALEVAERIRRHVKQCLEDQQVTVSIGVAQYRGQRDIVHSADQALYHAKEQGRNTVMADEDITSPSA